MIRAAYYIAICLFCLLLLILAFSTLNLYLTSVSGEPMNTSGVKFDTFSATDGTVLKIENGKIKLISTEGSYSTSRKNDTVFHYFSLALYLACLLLSIALVLTIHVGLRNASIPNPRPVEE